MAASRFPVKKKMEVTDSMCRHLLWIVFGSLLAYGTAEAKVARIDFRELVSMSDVIVVAKVESVSRSLSGNRNAFARVKQVWKGKPGANVKFLASPTWTCDTSTAIKGETIVLFLTRVMRLGPFHIAHSGRGRMPVRVVRGRAYATIQSDGVLLPKDIPTAEGAQGELTFMRSVEMTKLEDLVVSTIKKRGKK